MFTDTHGTGSIRTTRQDHKTNFLDRPPHQIMAWVGLERYGYLEEAQRLAYRFLYMFVILSSILELMLTFLL
jgi:neutral trehalase